MYISWIQEDIKQCVQQWVLIQVSTPSELFSLIYSRNFLKKNGFPYDLSTLPKTFYPVVPKIKSTWAWWYLLDRFEKQLFRCSVVDRWYSLDVGQFFFNCFALSDNFLRLITWKIASSLSPNNPQHLPSVHMSLELSERSFSRVFWEILSRKHGFLGRVLLSRFVFLHLTPSCHLLETPSCHLLEPFCSETAFAKQRLDFTDFWDDKVFFFS